MGYIVGSYYTSWSIYEHKHYITDIPIEVTHVFYAFMKIDPNSGEVQLGDSWADAEIELPGPFSSRKVRGSLGQLRELKKLRRHLKALMSIGGWGANDSFVKALRNQKSMNHFVESAVHLANIFGFDGVDIDWEYPSNDAEARQLVQVLAQLRAALGPQRLLSVACPGGHDTFGTLKPHIRDMDKYLSFWNVMCYDFAGKGWSNKSGYHSNLFGHNGDNDMNSDSIMSKYHAAGVPCAKLVLGMPAYARVFANPRSPEIGQAFEKSKGPEDLEYKNIRVASENFDHRKVSAFAMDERNGWFLTYDSQTSARIKAKYVELHGYAGGMWWCSYGDAAGERSLVGAFVDQIGSNTLDDSENWLG